VNAVELNPYVNGVEELMRQLNDLGAEGWELISITRVTEVVENNTFTFAQPIYTSYLKRAYMAQISDR
jgi:hypothetical protein